MFCKKCGAEMNDDARFCPTCGYYTQGGATVEKVKENKVEDNEVKYQLKPKFHLGYKFITNFARAILYIVLFGFIILGDIDEDVRDIAAVLGNGVGIAVGVLAIYMVIKLIFEKIQYDHFEYNFYNTKVEYIDGFLNKEEKELKYKHIREVALKQNILERIFGIGTIRIFTNATSGYAYGNHNNMKNMNGIQIHCVANPKEQYEKVKALIDAGAGEE